MTALLWAYPFWLALFSIGVAAAERIWPWRPEQRAWRRALPSDFLHLLFNGHFLGMILYALFVRFVQPALDGLLVSVGLEDGFYFGAAASWPIWLQIVVALVVIDFLQWIVHNLLHRVPALWKIHQVHHSVVDGEMDWIVSFRFHWLEVVLYKSFLYLPLAFFGFGVEAVFFHAVFGTLIGHLNHANLPLGRSPLRFVLNSPRMHIWHHDVEGDEKTTKNFGIIFSTWDWIFGTAYMPDRPPAHIGYHGVEEMPKSFFAQAVWPLSKLKESSKGRVLAASAGGIVVIGALAVAGLAPARATSAEMFAIGEQGPSSQPSKISAAELLRPREEADRALEALGSAARAGGFAHPEWMVSADELAAALGSKKLVLLDVRSAERFRQGHIPSARRVDRTDYSDAAPIAGLSRAAAELEALLRRRGVSQESVVVLYGDGGAEPYRFWWTLREVAGLETRILDGGLQAWKALQLPAVSSEERRARRGDFAVRARPRPRGEHWEEIAALLREQPRAQLVDSRTKEEYLGEKKDDRAARAGRIPGAIHLDWVEVLHGLDAPALRSPVELRERFARAGIDLERPIVAYCQSATRSAVLIFALLQLGVPEERLVNYGGSWAEYSALDLPAEPAGRL